MHRSHEEAPNHSSVAQGGNIPGGFKNVDATTRDQKDEEDDMEVYRCLIEEDPPPSNDT